jgi:poly(A) polymerase
MSEVIEALRKATEGTKYEGKLFLVGGIVRDRLLNVTVDQEDVDIVLEGDASELAYFLYECGIAEHRPVTYPRFGTAMVTVLGRQVELVSARRESYDRESRKPHTEPGTLLDDILRRDFTINTLLQNLHTNEILDLTGLAKGDLEQGIIRTPRDPRITFEDDPLRMLRAIRFAVKLNFTIESSTYEAIRESAYRLKIVSAERIRDEFVKILMSDNACRGLEMLRDTGLLDQFAPEISAMHGVTQNVYHIYDVWEHTLKTLESVPPNSGITIRLAALLHDVGKPKTKTIDENGSVHFYHHQSVGAEIARSVLGRLRFPNSVIDEVAFLISMHLRVGEYDEQWSDAAVRRLIRDAGDRLEDLIRLTEADKAASNPNMPSVDIDALRSRIESVRKKLAGNRIKSPLTGREIMEILNIEPGPEVGRAKAFLEEQIVEGVLLPGDKAKAVELLLCNYQAMKSGGTKDKD